MTRVEPDAAPLPAANSAGATDFDVVIVGASLAGCTAARLYAMRGLRVALVELHRDNSAYKHLCTHFIQASATPTLTRLGLDRLIEDAGGLRNGIDVWTRYGWTGDVAPVNGDGSPVFGYNIRRLRLDPIFRQLVAATPGVTLLTGCPVHGLLRERGAIRGIEIGGEPSGSLQAKLVVAADGRNSPTAALARVKPKSAPNCRFAIVQPFRDVPLRRGHSSQMWFYGEDVGFVFPNEDEVTVIACMQAREKLPSSRDDAAKALRAIMATLPDAPDLTGATALDDPFVVKEYPNLWRPAVVDGMALVGDAMLSIDPLWGVGCGFAFQTAEWLADSTAASLLAGKPINSSLLRYSRLVSRRLSGHRVLINDFSRRRAFNPLERLMFSAAARNREMSRHLHAFGTRLIGPARFLSPVAIARAAWVNLTYSAAARARARVSA